MPEAKPAVVLVGSSLTHASDTVVRAGLGLARATGASVHVVNAITYPVELFDSTMLADRVLEELRERERAALLRELTEQAERLGIRDQEIDGLSVEAGEPHRVLIDLTRKLHPAAVVVGAAEVEGRSARVFGSTAGRVIRKATCPVLVVRGELRVPPERVLLAVDLSPLSADVARSTLSLLDRIRVDARPEVEVLFILTGREERLLRARSDEEEPGATARRHLHRFTAACRTDTALTVTERLAYGEAADEILERASELHPDLIAVGTHGRSGFERLMIGSVAADVARSAPTSVLVVPPEAALRSALAHEAEATAAALG